MRPDYVGFLFLGSAILSFNAGIWQCIRRKQKQQLLERHKNLDKPPLTSLPKRASILEEECPTHNNNDTITTAHKNKRTEEQAEDALLQSIEFQRITLSGTFDNAASCLVGPRSIPSYKGASDSSESQGGFLVLTPFEVAHTKEVVMVNRGWVPIDAGKHKALLFPYIGTSPSPSSSSMFVQLSGLLRREEFLAGSFLFGESVDNRKPVAEDLSWLVIRPWEMARDYFRSKRKFKSLHSSAVHREEDEAEQEKKEEKRHYFIEMVEDYSGRDQRMVRGKTWPRRRDIDEVTYVHLTPIVHTMYIFFWWSITVGSLFGMGRCYKRQREIFALRKHLTQQAEMVEKRRQSESASYAKAIQDVAQLQDEKKKKIAQEMQKAETYIK